jgi:hypothetical protein
MRIIDRETASLALSSSTRTVQNFGKLLSTKPEKLGQIVHMKPDLSISMLTDALQNVYRQEKQSKSTFTPINAMAVEWQIDVNYIPKVRVTGAISGNGIGGKPETITLEKRYYDRNDTFALDNRQQLFVMKNPEMKGPTKWEYTVVLIGNDPIRTIDTAYGQPGRNTRYRSNYHPELSERGYTKFTSNTETHRNYLSRHRASVDWSADFAMEEDVFIADGKVGNETIYKMNKKEKDCLDQYLLARENSLLFSECNFDINGKCLLQDEKGRDIPMGDGILPQIQRVCDKFTVSNITTEKFEDAMQVMSEKSTKKLGNTWTIICNDKFWNKFNRLMRNDLRFQGTDNAYFWSKTAGSINVGATFTSYEFAGNTLVFMLDSTLSLEYDDRAFAIMLDVGKDEVSGRPNIATFTREGAEITTGNLNGMGGASGKESGEISTSVHGSSYHLLGYSGAVVFNPYRSLIIEEGIAA